MRWDWKCHRCNHVETFSFRNLNEAEKLTIYCPSEQCSGTDTPMVRQPAAPAFRIEGYSAANGYTKPS